MDLQCFHKLPMCWVDYLEIVLVLLTIYSYFLQEQIQGILSSMQLSRVPIQFLVQKECLLLFYLSKSIKNGVDQNQEVQKWMRFKIEGAVLFYQYIYIMNREQVLELIETIVRPLREKIDHLQKENERIRVQLTNQRAIHNEPPRVRSRSRQQQRQQKREENKEVREVRTPSIKRKDDKPLWNHPGKFHKAEQPGSAYKSPPPIDKKNYKQVSPRVVTRHQSKQRQEKVPVEKEGLEKKESVKYLSFEKQQPQLKPIKGGQKFSEPATSSKGCESLKENSNSNLKPNNPQNSSKEPSELNGSQIEAEVQKAED